MVGIVAVAHRGLAQELVATAEMIVGKIQNCIGLSIDPNLSVNDLRRQISEAIQQVNEGNGVIILTDMFGGTPSNISLSYLNQTGIEVVTGVNLPMLIKLSQARENMKVDELARAVKEYGQRSISLASEILTQEVDE
ncbi:MAG: PTS sugar transporter subunit IIA [Deltaproteobacteria bacterium]|nr:MAG: PTS sugar transporter subunit IIA [Deltaproteobacteria bacterium]